MIFKKCNDILKMYLLEKTLHGVLFLSLKMTFYIKFNIKLNIYLSVYRLYIKVYRLHARKQPGVILFLNCSVPQLNSDPWLG